LEGAIILSIFHDLTDVKLFIRELAENMPAHLPYKTEFDFFSSINCTTQSEYREELKKFLEVFVFDPSVDSMPDMIKTVYPKLVELYDWL